MATERKFAISTTPNQPGYEATYTEIDDVFDGIGIRDLQAEDEKIIIQIFPDFGPGTPNMTRQVRPQNWNGSRATDNYVVIEAVPGSEFNYPAMTGARIQIDSIDYMFLHQTLSLDFDFLNLGVFCSPGAGAQIWYETGAVSNSYMDRCYVDADTRPLFYGFLRRVTNSVLRSAFSGNRPTNRGDHGINGDVFGCTGIVASTAITGGFWWYRCNTIGTVWYIEPGGVFTTGFSVCTGDYNASQDATPPGGNSIDNIIPANEFVNPASDANLLETSQLRDAGDNLFGSGFDVDLNGNPRPNAAWDIGALQYVSVAPVGVNNALFTMTRPI